MNSEEMGVVAAFALRLLEVSALLFVFLLGVVALAVLYRYLAGKGGILPGGKVTPLIAQLINATGIPVPMTETFPAAQTRPQFLIATSEQ